MGAAGGGGWQVAERRGVQPRTAGWHSDMRGRVQGPGATHVRLSGREKREGSGKGGLDHTGGGGGGSVVRYDEGGRGVTMNVVGLASGVNSISRGPDCEVAWVWREWVTGREDR